MVLVVGRVRGDGRAGGGGMVWDFGGGERCKQDTLLGGRGVSFLLCGWEGGTV